MTEDDCFLESMRALFISKPRKELLFSIRYLIEDWDCEDINIIFDRSDKRLSDAIIDNPLLSFLSPEVREDLRLFTIKCGRLIACVEGSISLFLSKDKKSVDIAVISSFFSGEDKTMDNIRYIMEEASEMSIDISPNGRDMVLSVTYDLMK